MERAPTKTGHYAFDRITEADRSLGGFEDGKWPPPKGPKGPKGGDPRRLKNWYGRQYPPLKTSREPTSQNVNALMPDQDIAKGFRPRFMTTTAGGGGASGLFGGASSMLGDSLESASTTNMPPWGGVGPLGSVVSNSSSQETRQGGGAGLGGFGTLSMNLGSASTTVGRRSVMSVDSSLSVLSGKSASSSSSVRMVAADYCAMTDDEARAWLARFGFDPDEPLRPQQRAPVLLGKAPGETIDGSAAFVNTKWYPIHKAAELGDLRMVKWIAARAGPGDLQVRDELDYTPMNLASQNRRLATVRFLAGNGGAEVFKFDPRTIVKYE
jgi:hypothetical protein